MEPGIVAEFEAWVEENPLRTFRGRKGLTQGQTALLLGVGLTAIQRWESGAHLPSGPNVGRLAELMETSTEAVNEAWAAWFESKPGGPRKRTLRGGRPV